MKIVKMSGVYNFVAGRLVLNRIAYILRFLRPSIFIEWRSEMRMLTTIVFIRHSALGYLQYVTPSSERNERKREKETRRKRKIIKFFNRKLQENINQAAFCFLFPTKLTKASEATLIMVL